MNRQIRIQMEYPETCALLKQERDEMPLFIQGIIKSYIYDDHETRVSVSDEYGKESVELEPDSFCL